MTAFLFLGKGTANIKQLYLENDEFTQEIFLFFEPSRCNIVIKYIVSYPVTLLGENHTV